MLHQEGILSVQKTIFALVSVNELKFCGFILLLLKTNEACCINKWLHSLCMFW